ncbi:hypothetical protein [Streptomyces sp. Tue6028]|uniref:hypothetical protein n=1 Tax=Streptomyces sp. Tue6028 TaxID=2036037 RepID=UPI003D756841
MVQLKPVSVNALAEAREEVSVILARLMTRMAPGEHILRLGLCVEGQEPLGAKLPVTVEGKGDADDLVGVEQCYMDNFAFLLTCGLAQTLSYGVMYLRSPAAEGDGAPYVVQAWDLDYGVLGECTAARAAELIGDREPAVFRDAFGVHTCEDDDSEDIYPPAVYTVL